jgi:RNA polymerase sigma factor (sigma-70 family)
VTQTDGAGQPPAAHDRETDFRSFVGEAEPRLRRALVAAYGYERGREATAEAFAYAWEHWDRLVSMANPVGYLYRVGQSRTRSRKTRHLFERAQSGEAVYEPGLRSALATLSRRQRLAVVLVHGYGWTLREVAEVTGLRVPTIQRHVERGLSRLRAGLGASHG